MGGMPDEFEMDDFLESLGDEEFDTIGPGNAYSNEDMDDDDYDIVGDINQHMILSYLTANPNLWTFCSPLIKETYFDKAYGAIIRYIKDFENEYNRLPSPLMIQAETGVRLEKPDDAMEDEVHDYISDRVEKFCRHRAFIEAIHRAAENITVDSPAADFQRMENEMAEVINMRLNKDLGFEVHESVREVLQQAEKTDGISTGFNHLDAATDGGTTMPSFNIVSAGSGDGKSIFMQNMAVNYAEMGFNVVFYSLELEPSMITKRFSAMMTNTHISHVYRDLDSVVNIMKNRSKKEGKIWLHKLPMTGTTVADIKAHYNSLLLNTGEEWTVVIIDYLDIMDPIAETKVGDIHDRDKAIAREINDFAHDKRRPKIVWSASQQTKGAEEEKDARKGAVSGGVHKVNTCDNLIILKRTIEDQQAERTWAHIQKARASGAKGVKIPIFWHSGSQRMTDGDDGLFIEANPIMFNKGDHKKFNSKPVNTGSKMVDHSASNKGKAKAGSETRNTLVKRFKRD